MFKSKKTDIKVALACFALCVLLSACNNVTKQVKNTAMQVSTHVTHVKKEVEDFNDVQLKLAKARQDNLSRLVKSATELEIDNESELNIWNMNKLGSKQQDLRVLLYRETNKVAQYVYNKNEDFKTLTNKQNKVVSDMESTTKENLKVLNEIAKALANLSKEQDFEDQIKFFAGYFSEVKDSYSQFKDDATSKAGKAESKLGELRGKAQNRQEDRKNKRREKIKEKRR